MDDGKNTELEAASAAKLDIRSVIRDVIEEFAKREATKAEPAYKNELTEERKRREQLERRVNELVNENLRSRKMAEEAERNAAIRAELQRLGVTKVDLAFRAVQEDIKRSEEGHLVAQGEQGPVGMREYLTRFVGENPEFLPARNLGGSGMPASSKPDAGMVAGVDLDKIKPGMTPEELERIRQEVARVAAQSLGGR